MLFLKPGRTYRRLRLPLLAAEHHPALSATRDFFSLLFGDSSFIVGYMRSVGWNLNKVEQTGSNFGTNQQHENPFLCDIGSGTMVSDGLSMINMHMSATVLPARGMRRSASNNYLGNNIYYPPDGTHRRRTSCSAPRR